MRRRRLGWIGIDLGTRVIKVAQVERIGSRMRLHRGVVLVRAEQSVGEEADDSSLHPAPTAEELRAALMMRIGFHGRTAACVLPMHKTDLRSLIVPDGSITERRAMVTNELSAVFGSALDERDFDFWETQILGGTDWQNTENVGVLSVARECTSQLTDEISAAGLRCEVLDGLPLTLARAVAMTTDPEAVVGALDWGHTEATFCIVSGGRPLFTRVLRDCPLAELTETVTKELGLLLHEGQQLFHEYGLPDSNADSAALREVQETIATVGSLALANLIEELKKTLSYLDLHRPHLAPSRLWLFGGGAAIRNVAGYLSSKVGIPMQPWRLPDDDPSRDATIGPPAMLASAMALSALAFAT